MLERRDLEEHIAEIKNKRNQTESECIKLAAFVILRDELQREEADGGYGDAAPHSATVAETIIGTHGDSDFLQLIVGQDADRVWTIINEAMETLKATEPRFYAGIMRRIEQL